MSRGRFDRGGRGTTVWEPGMGSPFRGAPLHGNDGGGWLVSLRRTYRRADTWVRPYGWSRAHPTHRIPHPHRAGEGGFQTRPYGEVTCTGTTVWGGGDGFPFARERRWWVAGFFTPHLPAGGHVGPPLRLVTRASPSSHSSPAPRRGGRVSNPPLREVTWVIGVIWERGRDCLNQDLWD